MLRGGPDAAFSSILSGVQQASHVRHPEVLDAMSLFRGQELGVVRVYSSWFGVAVVRGGLEGGGWRVLLQLLRVELSCQPFCQAS